MKYITKPVAIEAMLLTLENYDKVCDFTNSTPVKLRERAIPTPDGGWSHVYDGVLIKNPEGEVLVCVGDYIIKGEDGTFRWCDSYTFENTYDCIDTPLDRMYLEIEDLVKRFSRLEAFMKTDEFLMLPAETVGLLEIQYGAMLAYNHALQLRVAKMNEIKNL